MVTTEHGRTGMEMRTKMETEIKSWIET
jgi:hypothetical protein